MGKKTFIRVISFLSAALLVAVGFAFKQNNKLKNYKLQIQNSFSRSLDGLNESVNNISLILEKAEFVTTAGQQSKIATELLSESEIAKNALAELPNGRNLTVLNRFLSQVGNYAFSVSKSLISGETTDKDYADNIAILKDTAKIISEAVNNSTISYNNPTAWAEEIDKELYSTTDSDSLASSFDTLEESLTDYPTLVYDGPYSDHILKKEPAMLKDAVRVTPEKALQTASLICETDKDNLSLTETSSGKIPSYRFTGKNMTSSISCDGGYALYMRKTREIADYSLEYKQALVKAQKYLSKIGMSSLTETYYFTDEGVCVISFAFLDGKTVCYTDLVKVGVAMDNGEIVLYEASGYISNHTDRAFETAAVPSEKAAEVVSDRLKIRQSALALIPTDSGKEVRCYEFVCTAPDDREILVYINAVTLAEEDILILLKTDGGSLAK